MVEQLNYLALEVAWLQPSYDTSEQFPHCLSHFSCAVAALQIDIDSF